MFECEELEFAPEWDGHTPDQAIERIGKLTRHVPERTCRNKGDQFVFVCSECGLNLELDCDEIGYGTPMVFREGKDVRKLDKPSYCPNCGARIIEDPN